jgi:1,4-alpha-glucan branching enzyme
VNPHLGTFLARESPAVRRLVAGEHPDPASMLGWHESGDVSVFLAWIPGATRAWLGGRPLTRIGAGPLYGWAGHPARAGGERLRWRDAGGRSHDAEDAWTLPATAPRLDPATPAAQRELGARVARRGDVEGVAFAAWAPGATALSVVIDDRDRWPMRRAADGIWHQFVPGAGSGVAYRYDVFSAQGHAWKTDPWARQVEPRPGWHARVPDPVGYDWSDAAWLRARRTAARRPTAIYELHVGSFAADGGAPLSWEALAARVLAEVAPLGFTHVELLPVMAHPHAASWGYQATGFFAPDSRHGPPAGLCAFVDRLHGAGLGVILDWVPGHFATDPEALARFDGAPLFEPADPRRAEHRAWGTLAFDFERPEVRAFLLASACHWLETYHVDGLRVDALASIVYLDFQRAAGEWLPAADGGRENAAAIRFLQELTSLVQREFPGVFLHAEDSSIRPGTTAPVATGGLGFDAKWSLGWMHDTLGYFGVDPLFRRHHHDALVEATAYAQAEHHVLPLSHDEVVHGKRSLLGRMPGDDWQRHANLRLLYAWQWTHPGAKLLFMGGERADPDEWDHQRPLPPVRGRLAVGVQRLVADLNALYRDEPALGDDAAAATLRWLAREERLHSVFAFERHGGDAVAVVVLNATPVPRLGFRLGLPAGGRWRERLNTDAALYGGSNVGNLGEVIAIRDPAMGRRWSAVVTLPPLAALVLVPA